MTPPDVPVLQWILEAGADDDVYDAFMVSGPIVIGIVAVIGRTTFTEALAALYVLSFFGYVLYNGVLPHDRRDGGDVE